MYITFDQYTKMGGAVSEAAFPALETQAEVTVDYYTQDRLKTQDPLPENLSFLMVKLIDLLQSVPELQFVNSFSHDGISVSMDNDMQKTNAEIVHLIDIYLPDYTYRGVD